MINEFIISEQDLTNWANGVRRTTGKSSTLNVKEITRLLNEYTTAGVAQATPSITVNSNGLITASATQSAGYVAGGMTSSTHQLAFQPAKTITPGAADQVAVSSGYYTGGDVIVQGDSNLVASNIARGINVFGVTGTHDGGVEEFVTRQVTAYENSTLTAVGDYAFAQCYNLTSVNVPACTSIGHYTFYRCTNLVEINAPQCTFLGNSAFGECSNLTSANFPECEGIAGWSVFLSCTNLTTVSFPKCKKIGVEAFKNCSSLMSASFPKCSAISTEAFRNCEKLTNVSFPVCKSIESSAFAGCSSLAVVSFPMCTKIANYAFSGCTALSEFYLTGSSICSLASSYAFSKAGITSTAGSIYVPASLYDSYIAATNWTYFSTRFVSI
jgi:hypothetical protein